MIKRVIILILIEIQVLIVKLINAKIKIIKYIFSLFEKKEIKLLYLKLQKSKNYKEWKTTAKMIDKYNKNLNWRKKEKSSNFNFLEIKEINNNLEKFIKTKKAIECSNYLNFILNENTTRLNNEKLYTKIFSGPKKIISKRKKNILKCLKMIKENKNIIHNKKKEIFKNLKYIYGNSCLNLSGGGALGYKHLGIISLLIENNFLPKIISGSSIGSIISGLICCVTDEELKKKKNNFFLDYDFTDCDQIIRRGDLIRKIFKLFEKGFMCNRKILKKFLVKNTFNLTFLEAFKKSGRILNITVSVNEHEKFKVLNFITAPNVYVWSAILASCSLPLLFKPIKIQKKIIFCNQVFFYEKKKVLKQKKINIDNIFFYDRNKEDVYDIYKFEKNEENFNFGNIKGKKINKELLKNNDNNKEKIYDIYKFEKHEENFNFENIKGKKINKELLKKKNNDNNKERKIIKIEKKNKRKYKKKKFPLKKDKIKKYYYSNKIKFIDGSICADIPIKTMRNLFNIKNFIVS